MSNEHQFHNPEKLTPEQYEASEGWRLLTFEELNEPQNHLQMFGCDKKWHNSELNGSECCPAPDVSYRTRAPLPGATAAWIKISDRKPTEADLPIIQGGFTENCGWTQIFTSNVILADERWTHWFPMSKIPVPPSNASADELDYIARYGRPHNTEGFQRRAGWLDGVRDERSFIRSILDNAECMQLPPVTILRDITKRVKLQ